jgi:arsenate reductase (thioredoxin)
MRKVFFMVYKKIGNVIDELKKSFIEISEERKNLLINFAEYISQKLKDKKKVNLIFICTHNSRRSHMSQIWAQTAAHYFNIPNIKCFSGGTEATAFNPRAVKAIKESGFVIKKNDESENPIYLVSYSENAEPIKCFSKVYSDEFNPQKNFAAIMTCSDADENCPVVFGAEKRFPIRYNDPKEFDDTDLEEIKYKERFDQIGIEMLFIFKKVSKK